MANFADLVGQFLQNAMTPSGESRVGNILQDLQKGLGDAVGPQPGSGSLLDKVLTMTKGALAEASQNPVQAAGIGAVLGSLLGGGSKSVSGGIQGGILALLAGVAYKALMANVAQGGSAPAVDSGAGLPLGLQEPQTPAQQKGLVDMAQLMLRGMINAAKADGEVSPQEITRIVGKLREAGLDHDAEAWLTAELNGPGNLDALVAAIPNQEVAAQIYAASLLAIEVDTPQERTYLSDLARKTGLPDPVVHSIHQTLGVAV